MENSQENQSANNQQPEIKRINHSSVLQICSAQVIIDLKSAVKELVENSLDAGCKNMEIKFYASGLNGFEVIDDGKGINEEDFEIIAKRGTTSKISEFDDIYRVKSLGFRGEALSSLCNVASVQIQTKKSEWQTGWLIKFDHFGNLIEKQQIARKNGTQVIVRDLFRDLPVRLIEYKKNHKTQYAKCIQLMQQYAMISCQTRITILNNQGEGMPFTSILRTNPSLDPDQALRDNIQSILGKPKFKNLTYISADFPKVKISGYLTQTVVSGSLYASKVQKDQSYCFLNNRPIDIPKKIRQIFTEIYRQFNASMNPIIILILQVEDDNYDINVSPDKREVFIKNEKDILPLLKTKLEDFFEKIQRVKAYDQADSGILSGGLKFSNESKVVDLLDNFKSKNTEDLNQQNEVVQQINSSQDQWISKKRTYDQISQSNDETENINMSQKNQEAGASQISMNFTQAQNGDSILPAKKFEQSKKIQEDSVQKTLKNEDESDQIYSQKYSKIDEMLQKFRQNTRARKDADLALQHQEQSLIQNSQYFENEDSIKQNNDLDIDKYGYKNESFAKTIGGPQQQYTIKCYEKSNINGQIDVNEQNFSIDDNNGSQSLVRKTSLLQNGMKIVEYSNKQVNQDQLVKNSQIVQNENQVDEKNLLLDYVPTDMESLSKTADLYLQKFNMVNDKILESKKGDSFDKYKILNSNESSSMSQILQKYQERIDRENSKIISDKNRYEVNTELREFEIAQREQNIRQKVKIQDECIDLDNDFNEEDAQHKNLELLNLQANDQLQNQTEEEFEESVKVVSSFKNLKKRIHYHDGEVIEIDQIVDLEVNHRNSLKSRGKDQFIQMDFEEMQTWVLKKQEIYKKRENLQRNKQQAKCIDLTDLMENDQDKKNCEKESFANIMISAQQLSQMFSKNEFNQLKVIGQFNKGFIISLLEESGDLFIIDQHAADEKFNFETLSKTTKIQVQDLVCPIKVNLSITEALIVRQHIDVFKQNGFKVVEEDLIEGQEKSENQFLIKSLPLFKKVTFTVDDFYELIEIVNQHLDQDENKEDNKIFKNEFMHKEVLRPTKIYHKLANRACRSSIMVGRDLDHKLMKKILYNLSQLQSPWNCPHGRPTLRFLRRMSQIYQPLNIKSNDVTLQEQMNMHKNRQPPPKLIFNYS